MSPLISMRILLLLFLFVVQAPRSSSQFEAWTSLSSLFHNRALLQSPITPPLSLCETDVCEAQRPDGVCDRWSLGSSCPERQVYHVYGDPGSGNDRAEMYLTLRSPWNISCSYGRCEPVFGATYDVFVAEDCIPERDYISEMQDTSTRTSKQVKIYLRRPGSFYLTVQRRAGLAGAANCSYGLTTGSIEAAVGTASCSSFRRMSTADIAGAAVPLCRDVMPRFDGFESSGGGAQATFIGVLVGVGLLSLAICVLGSVLLRRWRRRLKRAAKKHSPDALLAGVHPADPDHAAPGPAQLEAGRRVSAGAAAPAVAPAEPDGVGEAGEVGWKAGGKGKEGKAAVASARVGRRMSALEREMEDEDGDELDGAVGGGAGVLDAVPAGRTVHRMMGGSGSGLVLAGGQTRSEKGSRMGSPKSSGGSRGSSRGALRTPSPADELYRSRMTGRLGSLSTGTVEGAASRGPTPPDGHRRAQLPIVAVTGLPSPRRPPTHGSGHAGSEKDMGDVEVRLRSAEEGGAGSAEPGWEDGTGIRIDDILSQAAAAAPSPDKARAWRPGQPLDARSAASGSGSGSGSGSSGPRESASIEGRPPRVPSPPDGAKPPPPPGGGRPGRPSVAPLMAARLGLTAGRGRRMQAAGGRAMESIGGGGEGGAGLERQPSSRAVALASLQNIPRASQPGVPPPPPRPPGMLNSNAAANLGSLRLAQLQSSSSPGGRRRDPANLSEMASSLAASPPRPSEPGALSAAGPGAAARAAAAARDGRGMSKLGGGGDAGGDLGGGGPV